MAWSSAFDAVEADHLPRQVGERVPAGRQQVEGGAVGVGVDAERADDAELLVDDVVGVEAGRRRRPRVPATTTVPPARASATPWAKAAGALAVTSTTTSAPPEPVAAPERARPGPPRSRRPPGRRRSARPRSRRGWSRSPAPVTITNPAPASLAAAHDAQAADAGAEHGHDVARLRCRARSRAHRMPAPSGLNSVASTGSSPSGTGSSIESGAEVVVGGVAAPEARRDLGAAGTRTSWPSRAARSAGSRRAGRRRTRGTTGTPRRPPGRRGCTPQRSAAAAPTCLDDRRRSRGRGRTAEPGCSWPVYCSWSVPHSPHASTRSSPSSSPISGSSNDRSTRCRGVSSTRARAWVRGGHGSRPRYHARVLSARSAGPLGSTGGCS